MKRAVATLALAGCVACGGGGSAPDPSPGAQSVVVDTYQGKDIDLTGVLSLGLNDDRAYAASNRLYVNDLPEKWSPYAWAENARSLVSLKGQPERLGRTIDALLAELPQHMDMKTEGPVIRYDYPHPLPPYNLTPPWRSGFANAAIAIGAMQIIEAAPDRKDTLQGLALAYIKPAVGMLSWTDPDTKDLWFTEYIGPGLPNQRINVMNGHFFVIAALHEWRRRTDDRQFDPLIARGLKTFDVWLPKMIKDGFFSYARELPDLPDYGPLRAVNFAKAACQLYTPACDDADEYERLYQQWTAK